MMPPHRLYNVRSQNSHFNNNLGAVFLALFEPFFRHPSKAAN